MNKDEWLTPPKIIRALGHFDLDPCAPKIRPWPTAEHHYFLPDYDGIMLPWSGRVWLNPPYGSQLEQWLCRLAMHEHGTALVFARTETHSFFKFVWPYATSVLFLKGRLHFHHVDGTRASMNAGGPHVLIAYGQYDSQMLEYSKIPGKFIYLKQ